MLFRSGRGSGYQSVDHFPGPRGWQCGHRLCHSDQRSSQHHRSVEKRAPGHWPAVSGVQVAQPSRALRAELGLGNRDGIVVSLVIPGSAAEDAGLAEQDFLLSADGEALKEPGDLIKKVQKTGVGGKIVFVLIRNGQEMTITAVVGEDTSNR